MVSGTTLVGIVIGATSLALVAIAWLVARTAGQRGSPEQRLAPLVDEQATWTPVELGPPRPGKDVYAQAIEGIAALCLGELSLEAVEERWAADPEDPAEPGMAVQVDLKIDGSWHRIEPRDLGHRLDVDALVDELNDLLPEQGPRLAILDRDPAVVALAGWGTPAKPAAAR